MKTKTGQSGARKQRKVSIKKGVNKMDQMKSLANEYFDYVFNLPIHTPEVERKAKWDDCRDRWIAFCDKWPKGKKDKPEYIDFTNYVMFVMNKNTAKYEVKIKEEGPTKWERFVFWIWRIAYPSKIWEFDKRIKNKESWRKAFEGAKEIKPWYHVLTTNYNQKA